jgi:hypothetical protein
MLQVVLACLVLLLISWEVPEFPDHRADPQQINEPCPSLSNLIIKTESETTAIDNPVSEGLSRMKKILKLSAGIALTSAVLSGCVVVPQDALLLDADAMKNRQIQTRVFETRDREAMLTSASAVLQDLGFGVDDSDVDLGVIAASKTRDATSGGQVAGVFVLALLGVNAAPALDNHQTYGYAGNWH